MTKTHYPLPKTPRRDNSPIFSRKRSTKGFTRAHPRGAQANKTRRNPIQQPETLTRSQFINRRPQGFQATTPYP
ncbi:hypothetical protein EUGRSUZ_G02558 [Eucalyptus grandis]|uniref:Uncharacterized protein n=2 Tax=Eucalyptus grandis TaxID=71139 RepID=A0ACC3K6P4_EUCGR|nr:hypothetical protein EUGRSUZ_G02558 [Eucalyptus grandis]